MSIHMDTNIHTIQHNTMASTYLDIVQQQCIRSDKMKSRGHNMNYFIPNRITTIIGIIGTILTGPTGTLTLYNRSLVLTPLITLSHVLTPLTTLSRALSGGEETLSLITPTVAGISRVRSRVRSGIPVPTHVSGVSVWVSLRLLTAACS